MTVPEDIGYDVDVDDQEWDEERRPRRRRWSVLVAAILLLLLLCTSVGTSAQVWRTGGEMEAQFIARNLECLQCHSELIPQFNMPDVHNPFALKECTTCHTRHGKRVTVTVMASAEEMWSRFYTSIQWLPLKWWYAVSAGEAGRTGSSGEAGVDVAQSTSVDMKAGDSELIMPEEELCWLCHGSLGEKLDDANQHQPFKTGRCSECHNPHASANRKLLTQPINKICVTCHQMGTQLARDEKHPPAAQGWCVDCHDPHASDFKGILVARQRELCFRCHPSVATLSGMAVQHAPFLNDDCTGCHEAHGSDYMPLLDAAQPTLCYKCHGGIENQFARASHHPVGVTLTCSSCHDPHAAQYPALVSAQDNKFCYECHGEVGVRYEASAHEVVLCIRCHSPHGSDITPILRDVNPPLCLQCHAASGYDESNMTVVRNNHPVRPIHYDVNARENLTCTSSCHNPHGTRNTHMLKHFSAPSDGACLMCHAVTTGKRVGIDF